MKSPSQWETSRYQASFSTHNLAKLISFLRIHPPGRKHVGPSLLRSDFLHVSPNHRRPLHLLAFRRRQYAVVRPHVRVRIRLRCLNRCAGPPGRSSESQRAASDWARVRPMYSSTTRSANVPTGGCALDINLITGGVTRCRSCCSVAPGEDDGESRCSCCSLMNVAATVSAPDPSVEMNPSPVGPSAADTHCSIAEIRAAVPSFVTGGTSSCSTGPTPLPPLPSTAATAAATACTASAPTPRLPSTAAAACAASASLPRQPPRLSSTASAAIKEARKPWPRRPTLATSPRKAGGGARNIGSVDSDSRSKQNPVHSGGVVVPSAEVETPLPLRVYLGLPAGVTKAWDPGWQSQRGRSSAVQLLPRAQHVRLVIDPRRDVQAVIHPTERLRSDLLPDDECILRE